MAGFKGKYQYAVDEKGRISLPVKLRKNLSEAANNSFVVTKGYNNCLVLFPNDDWIVLEKRMLLELDAFNPEHLSFRRSILEWANDVKLDGQQRIMIPQDLLDIADIKTTVLIVGQLDTIELWNPEKYAQYKQTIEPHYETIAAKVMGRKAVEQ